MTQRLCADDMQLASGQHILGEATKVESGARGWNSVLKMIGCHRHDSQWGHCRCCTYVGAGHACLLFPIMAL